MSTLRNSDGTARPLVVICNPNTRRIELLQQSIVELGLPPPCLISYERILERSVDFQKEIPPDSIVKLESPGKSFEVERELLRLGEPRTERESLFVVPQSRWHDYEPEKGEIVAPRQWYYGWCELLARIESGLQEAPRHILMSEPEDVRLMFDKPSCQSALQRSEFNIPQPLGTITCFEELQELVLKHCCRRLFLKIANGSSASGVVGYQTDGGGRHRAVTTAHLQDRLGTTRLYNSRKLKVYTELSQVTRLVDGLGKHLLHVEKWFPKASIREAKVFDLRVVVIGGRVKHVVVRASHTPITNLHLLNERLDFATTPDLLPARLWAEVVESCERIMTTVFRRSLYAGLDVLIGQDLSTYAIAEVNAFGDQLNGILCDGLSTYQTEILVANSGWQPGSI